MQSLPPGRLGQALRQYLLSDPHYIPASNRFLYSSRLPHELAADTPAGVLPRHVGSEKPGCVGCSCLVWPFAGHNPDKTYRFYQQVDDTMAPVGCQMPVKPHYESGLHSIIRSLVTRDPTDPLCSLALIAILRWSVEHSTGKLIGQVLLLDVMPGIVVRILVALYSA